MEFERTLHRIYEYHKMSVTFLGLSFWKTEAVSYLYLTQSTLWYLCIRIATCQNILFHPERILAQLVLCSGVSFTKQESVNRDLGALRMFTECVGRVGAEMLKGHTPSILPVK